LTEEEKEWKQNEKSSMSRKESAGEGMIFVKRTFVWVRWSP